MNRIELVRQSVDKILLRIPDAKMRRDAYVHLYGVAQNCAILATKRKESVELAIVAGMLHDIATYINLDGVEHAHKSAIVAKDMLEQLNVFSKEEVDRICAAIYNHSDKSYTHTTFDELLKDADVMQHVFYNPLFEILEHEKERYVSVYQELNLNI